MEVRCTPRIEIVLLNCRSKVIYKMMHHCISEKTNFSLHIHILYKSHMSIIMWSSKCCNTLSFLSFINIMSHVVCFFFVVLSILLHNVNIQLNGFFHLSKIPDSRFGNSDVLFFYLHKDSTVVLESKQSEVYISEILKSIEVVKMILFIKITRKWGVIIS